MLPRVPLVADAADARGLRQRRPDYRGHPVVVTGFVSGGVTVKFLDRDEGLGGVPGDQPRRPAGDGGPRG